MKCFNLFLSLLAILIVTGCDSSTPVQSNLSKVSCEIITPSDGAIYQKDKDDPEFFYFETVVNNDEERELDIKIYLDEIIVSDEKTTDKEITFRKPYFCNKLIGGEYELKMIVKTEGEVIRRESVVITINPVENQLPKCRLTGPGRFSYKSGENLPLSVDANDFDGSIDCVEYYVGDKLVGSVSEPPYRLNTPAAGNGIKVIKAKAYDDKGTFSCDWTKIEVKGSN